MQGEQTVFPEAKPEAKPEPETSRPTKKLARNVQKSLGHKQQRRGQRRGQRQRQLETLGVDFRTHAAGVALARQPCCALQEAHQDRPASAAATAALGADRCVAFLEAVDENTDLV